MAYRTRPKPYHTVSVMVIFFAIVVFARADPSSVISPRSYIECFIWTFLMTVIIRELIRYVLRRKALASTVVVMPGIFMTWPLLLSPFLGCTVAQALGNDAVNQLLVLSALLVPLMVSPIYGAYLDDRIVMH